MLPSDAPMLEDIPGELLRIAFGVGFFAGALVAGVATWLVFA